MAKCKYAAEYTLDDIVIRRLVGRLRKYECPHEAIEGRDYCIFHDEEYQREHKDILDLEREFFKEIEGKIKKNEPIVCIGYNLPRIILDSETAKRFIGTDEFDLVVFDRCKFGTADFSGLKIKTTHFRGAEFEDVRFVGVEFENVYFTAAKFGKADFSEAKFYRNSDFGNTTFGEADFSSTNFNTAYFVNATFFDKAYFSRMWVKEKADFENVKFNFAYFKNTNIISSLNFLDVEVNLADFSRSRIGKALFEIRPTKDGIIALNEVTFTDPKNVVIYDFNPFKFSFLGTNVAEIQIHLSQLKARQTLLNSAIAKYIAKYNGETAKRRENSKEKMLWYGLRSFFNEIKNLLLCNQKIPDLNELSDETKNELLKIYMGQDKEENKSILHEIENKLLYEHKNLRKALENNKYYVEASSLFQEEMRILRESLKWRSRKCLEKLMHVFYATFSCYGESISRPLFLALLSILLPTLLYWYYNGIDSNYVINVTRTFFQIYSPDSKVSKGTELVVRILGAITLGLMFIAFRRRFERK